MVTLPHVLIRVESGPYLISTYRTCNIKFFPPIFREFLHRILCLSLIIFKMGVYNFLKFVDYDFCGRRSDLEKPNLLHPGYASARASLEGGDSPCRLARLRKRWEASLFLQVTRLNQRVRPFLVCLSADLIAHLSAALTRALVPCSTRSYALFDCGFPTLRICQLRAASFGPCPFPWSPIVNYGAVVALWTHLYQLGYFIVDTILLISALTLHPLLDDFGNIGLRHLSHQFPFYQ